MRIGIHELPDRNHGYAAARASMRVDSVPYTGTLTGRWEIDHYGCWWEYVLDTARNGNLTGWVIGECPD